MPQVVNGTAQLEALTANDPASRRQQDLFLDGRGDRAIETDARTRPLMLRWRAPDGTPFALGAITLNGIFETCRVGGPAKSAGKSDLSHACQEDLAQLIGGKVRETIDDTERNLRGSNARHRPASRVPACSKALLEVMDRCTDALSEALCEQACRCAVHAPCQDVASTAKAVLDGSALHQASPRP